MKRCFFLIAFFAAGCTTINVKDIAAERNQIKKICIELNTQVIVADFLSVVEDEFTSRGIATSILNNNSVSPECQYKLTYTARQSWDLSPFLSYAEIRIINKDIVIGKATYSHSGGFGFNKWDSTAIKMKPVFKQLFGEI